METKEYLRRAKELFKRVEEKLDEYEDDIDYDRTGDKLEIAFEKVGGPKMVVNTQQAIHEMWLAGNGRAWHFKFDETQNIWFAEAEQEEFYTCFAQLLSERMGRPVSF